MVCRSTPGMSVPMGLANIDSGLDDDQIQSLVHQLRHEYAGHQQHGTEPSDGHAPPVTLPPHGTRSAVPPRPASPRTPGCDRNAAPGCCAASPKQATPHRPTWSTPRSGSGTGPSGPPG